MRSIEGLDRVPNRSRSSIVVSAGLAATLLVAALQALAVSVVVGRGPSSDVFFAAYSLYAPLALLGTSLRTTLVPVLGVPWQNAKFTDEASRLLGRVLVLSLAVGGAFILPTQLGLLLIGAPDGLTGEARAILLLLALAASLQMVGGAGSAVFGAAERFHASVAMYVGSSAVGLVGSVALMASVGIVGAAGGLLLGSLAIAGSHLVLLARHAIRPIRGFDATRGPLIRLAKYVLTGVALAGAQQLTLTIALAAVSGKAGEATLYAYAFYATGVMATLSVVPLSLVTLPRLVEASGSAPLEAARHQVRLVTPYVMAALVPMLAAFALFAEEVASEFAGPLGRGTTEFFHIAETLLLLMLPLVLFALLSTIVIALRLWTLAALAAGATLAVHLLLISSATDCGAVCVARTHALAMAISAVGLLWAVFRRATLSAVIDLCASAWKPLALAVVFPAGALLFQLVGGSALVWLLASGAAYVLLAARHLPHVAQQLAAALGR